MLKRTISIVLTVCLLLTCMVPAVFAAEQPSVSLYSDVSSNHWAANDIAKWTEKGLFTGNPDGTFKPNNNLNRAELCAVINKVFGFTQASTENFTDIKATQWYAGVAAKAKAAGYTNSWIESDFKANLPVTRKEVAMAIFNTFKLSEVDTTEYMNKYTDLKEFKDKGAKEIASIIANGFMNGYSNKTFKPDANITRAEFVKVLNNAISEFYNVAGSYNTPEAKKNVIINTSGVILKDTKIQGNIYLAEGIGEGDVTLDNVTVKGKTVISGGGKNSIHLIGSTFAEIIVNKANGLIRLVSSNSSISSILLKSGLKFEPTQTTVKTLPSIIIDKDTPAGQVIEILGNVEAIVCKSPGVIINIAKGVVVNSLTIEEGAKGTSLKVEGKVTKVEIKATDIKINDKPIQKGTTGTVDGTTGVIPVVSGGSSNPGSSTPSDPWTLVWGDEFSGTTLDTTKWRLENKGDGFGNNEQQYYRPENATVKDGNLVIQAKKETFGDREYTSAKLFSKADWKYGKFEAKIKMPVGAGYWPAFWMMPADSKYGVWAASGEIDIMEAKGRFPDTTSGTIHYGAVSPNNKYTGEEQVFPEGQTIDQFHTYSIEWEPGEIRWYVDGNLFQTQNNWSTTGANGDEKYAFPAPFDENFYLMLNLAIGGNFDGNIIPADSTFPAQMEVDYVRAYELTGRPYKTVTEPSIPKDALPAGARQPDSTGNLLKDINFDNGINENAEGVDAEFGEVWNFIHNAQFSGAATATVEKIGDTNFAKVNVTNTGIQTYSVQLEQQTTLGKGRWYKYSFDAKADKNRTLSTKLGGGPTGGWAAYSDSYIENLTTEVKSFEHIFQMTRDTDILTRLEYNCATDTGTVWIGNVKVVEVDAPVVDYNASKGPLELSGNYIYNGTFDRYTIDRMSYWNVTKTGATATVSVPESTRELTANITDGGASANAITLDQKGLQLQKGNGYSLTFKAKADAARTIKVKVASKDGTSSYMAEQEIPLTTTMQAITVPFTMSADNDMESQLVFLLGGNNADVFIDDVELIQTTVDYTGVELYPLKNGDFSLGFTRWERLAIEGGAADFSIENGAAEINITNVGDQIYSIMLNQGNMEFKRGMEYELSFDAKASVARDIDVSIENSTYARRLNKPGVTLTTEITNFKYDFKITADEILALKIMMGNTALAATGTIYIDNVVLQVKNPPVKMAPMLGVDTTDNKVGHSVEVLFNEDAQWRSNISAIKVDGTVLTTGYTVEAGKLTLDATNFTADKGYTVSIEANGYAPTSVVQPILANDGNIILNGDMSKGNANWVLWNYGDSSPNTSNVTFENGTANINIKDRGPQNWSTQFFQEGIKLESGKTYELSFKARASATCPIQIELSNYNAQIFNIILTDTDTVYKKSFTASKDASLKLNYLIGNVVNGSVTTPTAEHTIYIDDLSLKEMTAAPVLIADNTENKLEHDIDITFTDNDVWRKVISAVKVDGTVVTSSALTITSGAITIDSSVFATAKSYTIAVDATGYGVAEVTQIVNENVLDVPEITADGTNNKVGQALEITFSDNLAWRNSIKSVKLNGLALAGSLYTVTPGAITITSSAISVAGGYVITIEADGYATPSITQQVVADDGNLIVNGDMANGMANWGTYLADGAENNNTTISVVNGMLVVNCSINDGSNPWSTQVYQDKMMLEAGKTYILTYDIKSTLVKPIIVDIEKTSDYNVKYLQAQTINPSSDMQTLKSEFTVGANESNAKLIFQLGRNNVPLASFVPHTFTIDNVKIVEKP